MGCDFCKREVPLTEHHLIPRTLHSNSWFKKRFTRFEMKNNLIMICRECHDFIHLQWDEKYLARKLNNLEDLLAEPKVKNFIKFIKKQK